MAIRRIPLVGDVRSRDENWNKDRYVKNAYIEVMSSGEKDKDNYRVVKRPGMRSHDTLAAGEGQAMVYSDGKLWAVIAGNIYKDGTVLAGGPHLATSGHIAVERSFSSPSGTSREFVLFDDGADIKALDTNDDSLTTVATSTKPTSTTRIPGVITLDGAHFCSDVNGTIYNTNLNIDLTDGVTDHWNAATGEGSAGNITGTVIRDAGVGILRHNNYILGLNEESTEIFYNAGTAGGLLAPFQGTPALVGCAAIRTAVNCENAVMWVARSRNGQHFVVRMDQYTPVRVSTPAVDQVLDEEEANISNARAIFARHAGHSFYILTLPTTAAMTLVYDIDLGAWYEWTTEESSTEGIFSGIASAYDAGKMLILDDSDGDIYQFDATLFQDKTAGNAINVEVVTPNWDDGTFMNKFMYRLHVVGDDPGAASNVSVSWSDDDYGSFSTARTCDLDSNPFLTRLGMFRRRAFKLTHTANTALRLHELEANVKQGHYGFIT